MDTLQISVRTNVKEIEKQLDYLAQKQLPYATAVAINSMASKIKEKQLDNFKETFDKPTPFTMSALGIVYANKNHPEALLFMKPAQEKYLTPYEFTFKQVAHKSAILNPRSIKLNQYGNIPAGKIKSLLGVDLNDPGKVKSMTQRKKAILLNNSKRYFMGSVTRKGEKVGGLWERLPGRKGLKLVMRFTEPKALAIHLNYFFHAKRVIDRNFDRILLLSLKHALDD